MESTHLNEKCFRKVHYFCVLKEVGFFNFMNHIEMYPAASAITLTSRGMFVTTLWEKEGVLSFFFFFFSRPQSSEFLQPTRVEMLEKVSNSQEKPLSIINFPASSSKNLYFCQAARFLWGTDNVRNRFVGVPLKML